MIAANLIHSLLDLGADVHALARNISSWRLKDVGPRITRHVWSMTDRRGTRETIENIKPSIVFHTATSRVADAEVVLNANVLAALGLLEGCISVGGTRVVLLGSSLEYGQHNIPVTEDMHCAPDDIHAVSKLAVTSMARGFVRKYDLNAIVLRLFHVYGRAESDHRLVPTALRAHMENRPLRLTRRGYVRDYIHVDDVVRACLTAARSDNLQGEVFNVGTGVATDNHDVVALVAKIAGRTVPTTIGAFSSRPTDRDFWCADVRKAAEKLGWRPEINLETGLRLEWQRMLQSLKAG